MNNVKNQHKVRICKTKKSFFILVVKTRIWLSLMLYSRYLTSFSYSPLVLRQIEINLCYTFYSYPCRLFHQPLLFLFPEPNVVRTSDLFQTSGLSQSAYDIHIKMCKLQLKITSKFSLNFWYDFLPNVVVSVNPKKLGSY